MKPNKNINSTESENTPTTVPIINAQKAETKAEIT